MGEVFGDIKPYRVKEIGCRHNKFSSVLGFIKFYHDKLSFRDKLAYTVDKEIQEELINKRQSNNSSILGKIYGYFFNN